MTDISKIVFLWCRIPTSDINSARLMVDYYSDAWNFATLLINYDFKYIDMEGGFHGPSYILNSGDSYTVSDSE